MLKVLVNGCNGKMGQIVCDLLNSDNSSTVVGGFDRENNGKFAFPIFTNIQDINVIPDVIIDFSVPCASLNILNFAKEKNIPIVIATTGFSDDELNTIKSYSKEIPIFQSSNMSFDINLMKKIVVQLAKTLTNTDIEIIETHHNRKVDSPSGTAQMLADSINEALGNTYHCEYDRHSKREKRDKHEIGMSSIRGGNIVGEHTVKFFSDYETFEVTHTSYSRSVFAEGAIKAAKFLVKQKPGLYNMDNLD